MTTTLAEPAVKIELRSGPVTEVADVSYPKRIVTVVAMPYERPTTIYEPDRSYQEVVSRSAFAGIEKRPKKVAANRDHLSERTVGGAIALHPSRTEGLVAELKISNTVLGNDTLELAADGWLHASAGFGLLRRGPDGTGPVWDDAELWERNGTLRRLNRLFLDHVAFVPNPAYDDAVVLDVRAGVGPQEPPRGDATPNRDWIEFEAQKAAKAALDARWLNS